MDDVSAGVIKGSFHFDVADGNDTGGGADDYPNALLKIGPDEIIPYKPIQFNSQITARRPRFYGTNAYYTELIGSVSSANTVLTMPTSTGTIALTSQIPTSGISSGNVATFTSGVVDSDFLRVDVHRLKVGLPLKYYQI